MAKTKTPFFSFGSQGSVGESVTTQKLGSTTMLREKPLPSDPYSLPQAYQRWLYEDYAYLWRQQSAATQANYRAEGSRLHLTGFQYWMKYQLKNLPDIAGMWHLDEKAGTTAIDFSNNSNNGTIFGPSPTSGLIDGALYFDGINDRIDIPSAPSLQLTGDLTIEAFGTIISWKAQNEIVFKSHLWEYEFIAISGAGNDFFFFRHGDGTSEAMVTPIISISLNDPHHFAVVRTASPKTATFYLDGIFINTVAYAKTPLISNIPVRLGRRGATTLWHGILDHVLIYNRPLNSTEILRHSLRRYPS